MKPLLLLFSVIAIFPLTIHANCTDLLKLEVIKKIDPENSPIFSSSAIKKRKSKRRKFSDQLYRNEYVKFDLTIHEYLIPAKLKQGLKTLLNESFKEQTHEAWGQDLYNDLVLEIYLSKNTEAIIEYEMSGNFSKDTVISLLLKRSIQGGFSGKERDIAVLFEGIYNDDFFRLIQRGRYIIDNYFRVGNHGDLIHMFQLDLLIHILKNNNFDPNIAKIIYKWMGKDIQIVESKDRLYSAWNLLFDGPLKGYLYFSSDPIGMLTTPEVMNRIYMQYFGLTRSDVPSITKKRMKRLK